MKQTNISLPSELHKKVKEYGFKEGMSISEIVRKSLEQYLSTILQEKDKSKGGMSTIDEIKSTIPVEIASKLLSSDKKDFVRKRGEMSVEDYL